MSFSQGYLTKDHIFLYHPFASTINGVLIFNSLVVFHCEMYHIFSFHSTIKGHLGCFQLLNIIIKAVITIVQLMFLWYDRASFGYMSKSCRVVIWIRTIPSFLRNHQIDIQSGLISYQQWKPVLPQQTWQDVLSLSYSILTILTGVRYNLRVVLICSSLMTKDFEHFFKNFSAIGEIHLLRILCLARLPLYCE